MAHYYMSSYKNYINLTFYKLVYTDGKIMQKSRFNVVKNGKKTNIFFSMHRYKSDSDF